MDPVLRPPRRRNLAEDVAEYIRASIMSGALLPGERIDQDAIAAELGVSRLPVREALISLDKEGLIRNLPRRGAFVAEMDREDVLDHYQLFGQVAGLAAARAAARMTADEVDRLAEVHESACMRQVIVMSSENSITSFTVSSRRRQIARA